MDNKQAFVNPGGDWINRRQRKWGVDLVGQALLIVLVFSLAGSTAVLLRKAFFGFVGIDTHTAFPIKIIVYLAFLFPTYQCLLLVYGALLGQFRFFWNKERKMLLAMRRVFVKA